MWSSRLGLGAVLLAALAAGLVPGSLTHCPAWTTAALAQSAGDAEKDAFEAAKELGTIEAWEAFLASYPKGFHADLARAYLKRMSDAAAAPAASSTPAVVPTAPAAPAPAAATPIGSLDDFPVAAGSWGGIVRSGPGQGYDKLDSLAEGEPISLMGRSAVMENGFPWFKIAYRDGRKGYQWGGIICAYGAPRPDVFQVCPAGGSSQAGEATVTCPPGQVWNGSQCKARAKKRKTGGLPAYCLDADGNVAAGYVVKNGQCHQDNGGGE